MRHLIYTVLLVAALAIYGAGCGSAQKKRAEEQIVPVDHEKVLGGQLDANLTAEYGAWEDPVAEAFLASLVTKLMPARSAGVRLRLLSTETPVLAAGLARSLYVSRGMLRMAHYENELAFLLGGPLELLRQGAPARHLSALQGEQIGENLILLPTLSPAMDRRDYLTTGWFETGGIFDYGTEAYLDADRAAIQAAYAAHFDPRGAATLLQRWQQPTWRNKLKLLGNILPPPDERFEAARGEVAKLSPLRDPVIKSRGFEQLQARLQTVKRVKSKKKNG